MNETDTLEPVDLRGLVMSEGRPYILIVVEDPETGGVAVTSSGLPESVDLPTALKEIALLLADLDD